MNKFEENFIVSIDDSTLEYAKIKKISPNNHETYKKFVEYMLALYVNKIENYAYRDITNNAKFIYNHSSKQLFRHYYNKRKISNPDSPVLIYGKSAKRNIEIERIDYKLGTNNAIIYFKSNIESNIDGSPNYVNHAKWAAEIQFDLPNFKQMMGQKLSAEKGKSKENNNKLNFIVIEYKATKLN